MATNEIVKCCVSHSFRVRYSLKTPFNWGVKRANRLQRFAAVISLIQETGTFGFPPFVIPNSQFVIPSLPFFSSHFSLFLFSFPLFVLPCTPLQLMVLPSYSMAEAQKRNDSSSLLSKKHSKQQTRRSFSRAPTTLLCSPMGDALAPIHQSKFRLFLPCPPPSCSPN